MTIGFIVNFRPGRGWRRPRGTVADRPGPRRGHGHPPGRGPGGTLRQEQVTHRYKACVLGAGAPRRWRLVAGRQGRSLSPGLLKVRFGGLHTPRPATLTSDRSRKVDTAAGARGLAVRPPPAWTPETTGMNKTMPPSPMETGSYREHGCSSNRDHARFRRRDPRCCGSAGCWGCCRCQGRVQRHPATGNAQKGASNLAKVPGDSRRMLGGRTPLDDYMSLPVL